jgi:hypothetical protein
MAIRVKFSEINRFKKTRGFPRKEIYQPDRKRRSKYSEMEFWKRAKNVELHRMSRSKNAFDASETVLLRKEEWPYDGFSIYLDRLRQNNNLGAGW